MILVALKALLVTAEEVSQLKLKRARSVLKASHETADHIEALRTKPPLFKPRFLDSGTDSPSLRASPYSSSSGTPDENVGPNYGKAPSTLSLLSFYDFRDPSSEPTSSPSSPFDTHSRKHSQVSLLLKEHRLSVSRSLMGSLGSRNSSQTTMEAFNSRSSCISPTTLSLIWSSEPSIAVDGSCEYCRPASGEASSGDCTKRTQSAHSYQQVIL